MQGSRDSYGGGGRHGSADNRDSLWVSTPKFGLGVTRNGDHYNAAVRIGERPVHYPSYGYGNGHYGRYYPSYGRGYYGGYCGPYYPSYWFGYRSAYPYYGWSAGIGFSYCRPATVYYGDYWGGYYGGYYGSYYPSTVTIYQDSEPTYVVVPSNNEVQYEQQQQEPVYIVPEDQSATQTAPPATDYPAPASGSPYTPMTYDAPGVTTPYSAPSAPVMVAPSVAEPAAPVAPAPTASAAAPAMSAADRWKQYMDAGFESFTKGDFESAQRSFMRAMIADDRLALSTLMYGYANFALGDFALATEGVLRAISTDPRFLREPLAVRSLYQDQKVFEAHLTALTDYVAAHAESGGSQVALAYILFAAEQPDRAWFIVNDLARQNPDDKLLKEFHQAIVAVLEQAGEKSETAPSERPDKQP